jgi:phosphoribosylformimino-5-aminoimidazole carboxamide ribotide isomerase
VTAAAESSFVAWAAVDVLSGRAVRLARGEEGERTDYGPAERALARWAEAGLKHLHVVDLGGAFGREPSGGALVGRAARAYPEVVIQAAGGVRSAAAALALADAGASRVVVGTLLFSRPAEAAAVSDRLGPRAVAALDSRAGRVRVEGWTRDAGEDLAQSVRRANDMGFSEVLVTDIERDGMGVGPNLELYASLRRAGIRLLASGGLRRASDLNALARMGHLAGAVIGRALYEGTFLPEEIQEAWR